MGYSKSGDILSRIIENIARIAQYRTLSVNPEVKLKKILRRIHYFHAFRVGRNLKAYYLAVCFYDFFPFVTGFINNQIIDCIANIRIK